MDFKEFSNKSLSDIALYYAEHGFKIFPLTPDSKIPFKNTNGVKDATDNKSQISDWWKKHPDANIGLSGEGLVIIDVDVKDNADGLATLAMLERCIGKLDTLCADTPSGGRHYYYRYDGKANIKNGTKILQGIDIRTVGGYVVAPPSSIDNQQYTFTDENKVIAQLPPILEALLPYRKKCSELLPLTEVEQGERNNTIFQYCCRLRSLNVEHDNAKILVLKAAENCSPPFPEKEALMCLSSAWKYPAGADLGNVANISDDPDFQAINQKHAVIMVGGKCQILNEIYDPALKKDDINFSNITDFRQRYLNKKVPVGKKMVSIADLWLNHPDRRQYEGVVFLPDGDCPGYYNLWKGFACSPAEGKCNLYLDHLRNVVCSGDDELYDYLISWMAHAVQFPAKKPGTSIVFRGAQGTGKGVAIKFFGELFGSHFVHIASSKHLTGNFNSHLKNASLVFADEAVWGGDKCAEGVLKAMVTEDTIPIEHKGKDVFMVKNHIRLMVASNNEWCVPAGLEERRFVVIDISTARMQDHGYFGAIADQMDNGGREALLHYLMHYDLNGINLREIPQTAALTEMKYHSMNSVQKFVHDILMAGSWSDTADQWEMEMESGVLHDKYLKHARKSGENRKSTETMLGKNLYKIFPTLDKRRAVKTDSSGKKRQVWVYDFPELDEARSAFDLATKSNHDWPDGSGATKLQTEFGCNDF